MPDRRTLSVFGLIGVLAGGLLTVLAGPSVTVGVGWVWRSGAVAHPSHLVSTGGSHPGVLPLLPVALGAGLLAGLLVGVVVSAVGGAVGGSGWVVRAAGGVVVGALVAVGVHLWRWNGSASGATLVYHGRYAPLTMSKAYASTLVVVVDGHRSWWPLVGAGALAGLAVYVVVSAAAGRWVRTSTSPSGSARR